MRWEKLFADLEAQLDSDTLFERDAEIVERTYGEQASQSWRDRLGEGPVVLQVAGLGRIEGTLSRPGRAWILVQTQRHDVIVNPGHVMTVLSGSTRSGPVSLVDQRMTWVNAMRMLQRDQDRIHVVCGDGSSVDGDVATVGKDFLGVRTDQSTLPVIPFAAIAAVSVRSW